MMVNIIVRGLLLVIAVCVSGAGLNIINVGWQGGEVAVVLIGIMIVTLGLLGMVGICTF